MALMIRLQAILWRVTIFPEMICVDALKGYKEQHLLVGRVDSKG